jgi:serine/threonine protein kinase
MKSCPVCRNRFPTGANFCPHDGKALVQLPESERHPIDDRFVGTTLDGRYEVERRIGQGGMGVVYSARHTVIDKPVAIKVLRPEYCRKAGLVERFEREARAASRIGHPNIVDVTDFGKLDDGQVYLVMEQLVGDTLAAEIRRLDERIERMPLSRVIDLATQTCHGLSAAHAKGIVHRDLKPENIFIVNPKNDTVIEESAGYRTDFVKLLDFGIARFTVESARITQMGSVFGTPQYMSPEQAAGQDSDHRGDIYALGCIIYEMLVGRPPFLADTFMGTLTKQMYEPPVSPRQMRHDGSIPPPLEAAILRMLAKKPEDRFQSTAEVASALNDCFRTRSGPIAAPEPTDPPGPTELVPLGASARSRAPRSSRATTDVSTGSRWRLIGSAALVIGCLALALIVFRLGAEHWGGSGAGGSTPARRDAGGCRPAGCSTRFRATRCGRDGC